MPGGREAAEVIQSNRVHVGQQGAQSVDAPAIACPAQRLPVIDGVAPELSLGAEVVRRHAGHEARPALLVEQEQFRVGPDIARVGGDEEGQVADQAQAPGLGVLLEACPLAEQQELCEADLIDRVRQVPAGPGQGSRVAPDQLGRPLEVIGALVPGFQRPEQGVVLQPVRLLVAELLIGGPQVGARPARKWFQAVSSNRCLNGMTAS